MEKILYKIIDKTDNAIKIFNNYSHIKKFAVIVSIVVILSLVIKLF